MHRELLWKKKILVQIYAVEKARTNEKIENTCFALKIEKFYVCVAIIHSLVTQKHRL